MGENAGKRRRGSEGAAKTDAIEGEAGKGRDRSVK